MRSRRVAVSLWLLFLFCASVVVARTQLRTDMGSFLPRSSSQAQQVLIGQATNGAASRVVLLAIEGAPPATLAALSKTLALRLRQDKAFSDVSNGDQASIAALRDFVWKNRYLLSHTVTAERFTADGLHAALVNDLALLGSDMAPLVQQSLPSDPTGEMLTLLDSMMGQSGPPTRDGVWLSRDERRALLMVHTLAAGFDVDAEAQALSSIERAFDMVRGDLPEAKDARLLESGPPVFAVSTRNTTVKDASRLSILATGITASLLIFAYRSLLSLVLGLLPVATGALAAVAGVSLGFGYVHGITLGFGVTLIGESVDYAIYLLTQTRRGDTPSATMVRLWPTLRLCALTSIAGFAVMLFSDFTGFAQLGLFSILGLVAAVGTARFVLPQLLPQHFFAAGAGVLGRPLIRVMAWRSRLRPVVGLVVLGGIAALAFHRGGFWDNDLSNLSPIPPPMQALDRTLRGDLGVPDLRYFIVFHAETQQSALAESERVDSALRALQSRGRIAGYTLPSAILPSADRQQARKAALPDGDTLRARFQQALTGVPFRAGSFEPFFADVAAARAGPLITRANLPPTLALELDSTLVPQDRGWEVIAPLRQVADPAGISATLGGLGIRGLQLVDLNSESDQLLQKFQREATGLAIVGTSAIVILLLFALHSPVRVISVVAPLAAALVLTAAVLTFGGAKLSIFMIVGFLLTVAVGSNYCLFFERAYHDAESQTRSVASVALANLCAVSAYGVLALSHIPVLHDIGETVALGTFLSLFFAAILSTGVLQSDAERLPPALAIREEHDR